MRMLLVPMAAMAKMQGPAVRVRRLAEACLRSGVTPVVASARDGNCLPVNKAVNHELPVPVPLGLPGPIGRNMFSLASQTGLSSRKNVSSFEEILFLTGNLNKAYFADVVSRIRAIIVSEKVDAVYSEFNLAAIVAAKAEGLPVFCTYSYPTQPSFACAPRFAKGVNSVLHDLGQEPVSSSLELMLRADMRFVASIPELEPIEEYDTHFVGSFTATPQPEVSLPVSESEFLRVNADENRVVLVYMGNGPLSDKEIISTVVATFDTFEGEVYVAGMPEQKGMPRHIHTARRFNFDRLWPRVSFCINHGGQNTMADCLLNGVPQIIYPGRVFERIYNAESIDANGAGLVLKEGTFDADHLRASATEVLDGGYAARAEQLGDRLRAAGGSDAVITRIRGSLSTVH